MTKERLLEIFDSDDGGMYLSKSGINHIFHGLLVLRQFVKDADIEAAEHDIVYCCDVDRAIEAGLNEFGAYQLHYLNWQIEDNSFACYV